MSPAKLILAVSAALLLASCSERRENIRSYIPYVHEILSHKESREYQLLTASSEYDTSADLAFIGDMHSAYHFSRRFTEYDVRDNVDASLGADELKDFSGETLSCIVEDTPVPSLKDSIAVTQFRETAVRKMISSLDTLAYISPYDQDGLMRKNSSKLLILGTPDYEYLSHEDMSALLKGTSSTLQIVSPLELCLLEAFRQRPGKASNVGIISSAGRDYTQIYAEHFKKLAVQEGASGSRCVFLKAERTDSLIYSILDLYRSTGNMAPLDALIVDDYSLDPDQLKLELAEIMSVMNESSMTYGRLLAPHFKLYDSFEMAIEHCYAILRQSNLFTHNIALPQSQSFSPVLRQSEYGEQLILIPSAYVQN